MPRLADTHCHLYFNLFDNDLPEVIQRAIDQGIERILLPGIDLESSRKAVQLSEQYPMIFAAVGVHPNDASDWTLGLLDEIHMLANHPKVVAIGEIGLDYYRDYTSRELQQRAFQDQLEMAKAMNKPVILHSRQSISTLLPLVCDWQKQLIDEHLSQYPGVFHAFEGNLEEAIVAHEHQFCIGIGGPVTYKNALERQILATKLPLTHILLETDAPFLSPQPFRGQRNEPARIFEIAEKIAALREVTINEIAVATSRNADQLLGWSSFH